ncbi:MAG: hypothetical protein OQK94_02040 [Gammaproteobacteria bacterium]|nr:hypothetical protein [Gammaproteobacteria bacterium]MCW8841328.1 hypothetical protein [Gammaproteobacteria bacterium]MCW8928019.1 hypothetical protein [Gammaproteobacteria bacterium]MCW8959420.1 hypothetical protein [Gammaproteobacteria bacterium]MCW8971968.1 hypothetical protein [Gammaproteobacteria bacterium]
MRRTTGFTLIETLIFIIVVGIGIAGIAQLYMTNVTDSATPLIRERTSSIAKAYMDEIIAKRWDENTPIGGGCVDTDLTGSGDSCTTYCSALSTPQCNHSKCTLTPPGTCTATANVSAAFGTDTGETSRAVWDDLDDYNGHTASPPEDFDGNALTDSSGFTVSVTVSQPGSDWQGIPAADVRRIQVDVSNPLGETLTLVSYRVNM